MNKSSTKISPAKHTGTEIKYADVIRIADQLADRHRNYPGQQRIRGGRIDCSKQVIRTGANRKQSQHCALHRSRLFRPAS